MFAWHDAVFIDIHKQFLKMTVLAFLLQSDLVKQNFMLE